METAGRALGSWTSVGRFRFLGGSDIYSVLLPGTSGKDKVSLRNRKRAVVCLLEVAVGVCGTESRRDEITEE